MFDTREVSYHVTLAHRFWLKYTKLINFTKDGAPAMDKIVIKVSSPHATIITLPCGNTVKTVLCFLVAPLR